MHFETLRIIIVLCAQESYVQQVHEFNLLACEEIMKTYAEQGLTKVSVSGYNSLS